MKKILLILCMAILIICGNISSVFADAANYDVQSADFYVYVATPDGGLNMRYGPGVEYDKVTDNRIPDGVRLHVTLTSGHWGYTSYNGNDGWVTLKQTSNTPPATPKPATPKPTPKPETPVQTPTPVTAQPQQTVTPVTPEPEITTSPSAEPEYNEAEDATATKTALKSEFLLVAILVLFIVIIALLIVIIINIKSRK